MTASVQPKQQCRACKYTYLSHVCLADVILKMCFNVLITKAQPVFTYSKLTIETLEQGVKYVQS